MDKPVVLFIGVGAITAPIVTALKGKAEIYILAREGGETYGPLTDPAKGIRVIYNPEDGSPKGRERPPEVTMRAGKDYTVVTDLSQIGKKVQHAFLGLGGPVLQIPVFERMEAANILAEDTEIYPVANGVPIWFPKTKEAQEAGIRYVHAVDPYGKMIKNFGKWIQGCFSAAAARLRPIENGGEGRPCDIEVRADFPLFLGPPEGGEASPALQRLAALIQEGGGNVKLSKDIMFDASVKMIGNAVFNAMATWLDKSLQQISETPELAQFAREIMEEVKAVFEAVGVKREGKPINVQHRLDAIKKLTHKTSMSADFKKGAEPEIRNLMIAITEIGAHENVNVKTPKLEAFIRVMEDKAEAETPYRRSPTRHVNGPGGDIAIYYHQINGARPALIAA